MKALACFIMIAATTVSSAASLDQSFEDVSLKVLTRSGKRVQWNRGTVLDSEAERYVRSLLKRPVTANSAVQIALFNNHQLQATYEEIGIAQADLIEAGLLKNPLFSIERRWPGQALEMDILAEFVDLLFLPVRKRVAKAELEAAKLRVAHEILKTAGEVRMAFYEHQGNQQLSALSQSVEKATAASAEAALKLYEAGNTRALDLANEEALHVQARLDFAKAQSLGIESREKLNKLMGVWGEQTDYRMGARLADPPSPEVGSAGLEGRAIEQRLDLAALKYDAFAQAQRLGSARFQEIVQHFELGVHSERETDGTRSTGPSLIVPIPFFNFGQAAKARAEARVRQLRQRYLALAVEIRSEVRSARDRMLLARERVNYFQTTVLPVRRRMLEETQLQYNAMQIGVFDLLRAKQEEVNAGREYVEALRDYWVARADLEKAVGGSLSGKRLLISTDKEVIRRQ